jgi:hypothetical protein
MAFGPYPHYILWPSAPTLAILPLVSYLWLTTLALIHPAHLDIAPVQEAGQGKLGKV